MKPATALPWRTREQWPEGVSVQSDLGPVAKRIKPEDAAYIVAAANAYPRLVQALKALVEAEEIYGDQESVALNEVWLPAAVLLRDLGEL